MTSIDRLIDAGLELFHRHGIHPVGLDLILSHAGVTKTTFYKYFESKETFICTVLDHYAEHLMKQINGQEPPRNDGEMKSQLLGVLRAWDTLRSKTSYRGCLLIAAAMGAGDPHDPGRLRALEHKRRILRVIESMARAMRFHAPDRFAARFGGILDGSLVARQLYGDDVEAHEIYLLADHLIDNAVLERDSN